MKDKLVWVMGRVDPDEHMKWSLCGVFHSKEEAEGYCLHSNEFVGPVQTGKFVDDEIPWPDAYYPRKTARMAVPVDRVPRSEVRFVVQIKPTMWLRFRIWLVRRLLVLTGILMNSDVYVEEDRRSEQSGELGRIIRGVADGEVSVPLALGAVDRVINYEKYEGEQ